MSSDTYPPNDDQPEIELEADGTADADALRIAELEAATAKDGA